MKGLLFTVCLFTMFSFTLTAQTFSNSNLPIVIISTDNSVPIPDAPRVLGNMKIIFRGPGMRNYLTDKDSLYFLNYNGRIDIEIRGSYSQSSPKKAYGFTTRQVDNISTNNVSLLGMPIENDWILNAMSYEPSLIRDYLCYNLSRRIGDYASRTAYCELVVNGLYRGLYLLEEKIKPDGDRVDVQKIATTDNSTPEVTGGYITKADKTTGGDPIAWTMSSFFGNNDIQFIHDWPDPSAVTYQQNSYIKSVFFNLQSTATSNNISLTNGFPSIIDIPSFVDFMIINELSSNADAYVYSTYFHKDRNAKLRAGPIWDLNLTFGNDLFNLGFDRSKTDVWQFSDYDNEGPRFWRDLFNNTQYKCYLSKRWHELCSPGYPLYVPNILNLIDSTVSYISEAVVRENALWGNVGNHQLQINGIKTFINSRIAWIDNHIGPYSACYNVAVPPLAITKIMYHPAVSFSFPTSDDQEFIEITNTGNSMVDLTGIYFAGTGLVYQFPPSSSILPNSSIQLASNASTFHAKYGIFPFGQYTRHLSNSNYNLLIVDGFGNIIDHVHYLSLIHI